MYKSHASGERAYAGYRAHDHMNEDVKTPDVIQPPSLGISREELPQIPANLIKEFLEWLHNQRIAYDTGFVYPTNVKASQSDLNVDKIKTLMNDNPEALAKPIIVSKDGYILDGHHRWAALLYKSPHTKIPAYRINVSIYELIDLGNKFPKSFNKDITEEAEEELNYLKQLIGS